MWVNICTFGTFVSKNIILKSTTLMRYKLYFLITNTIFLLQEILSLAKARLYDASSAAVCRKLSSIGRRVLSIESVSPFQGNIVTIVNKWMNVLCTAAEFNEISTDGQEGTWEARWQHQGPRCAFERLSSDKNNKDVCTDGSDKTNCLSRQQVCDSVSTH